ncbi:MAG TPA: class II glutamine amidotransferase [Haliangium sp.]|nr:class II glutamine amidotransferase [Haliangium sp.]
MPNLLAMSFEGELSPSFDLRCLQRGRAIPDGWGLGYYPGGEPSASVLKEPAPAPGSVRTQLVRAWDHAASSVFLFQVRAARWGSRSDANTQPFCRSWGGRDWMFVHAGSLEQRPAPGESPLFQPVGSTDSEAVFCELLSRMAEGWWRQLSELDYHTLRDWLAAFNELGVLTCALTDGNDLVIYADRRSAVPVFLCEIRPPYERVVLGDDDLELDLTRRGAKSRKGIVAATNPLDPESEIVTSWRELAPGTLVIVRQGAIVAEFGPATAASAGEAAPGGAEAIGAAPASDVAQVGAPTPGTMSETPAGNPAETTAETAAVAGAARARVGGTRMVAKPSPPRPRTAPPRRLEVRHSTIYRYEQAVERSIHLLRLQPIHDRLQRLVSHQLSVSVDGTWRDYDDVFGNRARRLLLETPFTELAIESHALVVTIDTDPLEFRPIHARTTIPLNWMPWQRHMLAPYLLPPELPESQLVELHEYAMSFVQRNGYDLIDSLLDMNQSLYKDYEYKQGTTTLATTPFDTYANRYGVCQDFTNLFLCLARLLGIPARYVCGYLYTGPKAENRAMAEATHAWAQVYLPEAGWKGFDPTNGVLTQTDHVRVAVGRNYLDATPTSGTIYVGGGGETLSVSVTVEEDS